MKQNPVLKEKWKTQKRLSKEANYDIEKLVKNAKNSITNISDKLKIDFKYSDRTGGFIKSQGYSQFVNDKKD